MARQTGQREDGETADQGESSEDRLRDCNAGVILVLGVLAVCPVSLLLLAGRSPIFSIRRQLMAGNGPPCNY